jgi:peptidoglycan/LPS O-acetylase OafA/YrhL
MHYRNEIDGLRALAVISVILFHFKITQFQSGYLGVDIFFVISGFLIALQIPFVSDSYFFDFKKFYEKRLRRIIPTLFFTCFFISILSIYYLPPLAINSFFKELFFVLTFSANFYFWRTQDYFNHDFSPLINTWSLAVEEQFYFLFPIFIILILKKNFRITRIYFLLSLIASFLLFYYCLANKPTFGFYSIFSRFWEFLAGAYIAHYLKNQKNYFSPTLYQVSSLLSLFLLIFSITNPLNLSQDNILLHLMAVSGASFFIIFSTNQTFVGKIFSAKPFLYIGLRSYSLYLLVLPLIAFAYYLNPQGINIVQKIEIFLFGLAISHFSYLFVEKPYRNFKIVTTSEFFRQTVIVIFLFLLLTFTGIFTQVFNSNHNNESLTFFSQNTKKNNIDCHSTPAKPRLPNKACIEGNRMNPKAALIGDSHAFGISQSLNEIFLKEGIGYYNLTSNGCPVINGVYKTTVSPDFAYCNKYNKELDKFIFSHNEIEYIIVFMVWPEWIKHTDTLNDRSEILETDLRRIERLKAKFFDTYKSYVIKGKKVFLVYPNPYLHFDPYRFLWLSYTKTGKYMNYIVDYNSVSDDLYLAKSFLDDVSNFPGIYRINTENLFCSTNKSINSCKISSNYAPYYFDSRHLSIHGSELVTNEILKIIKIAQ